MMNLRKMCQFLIGKVQQLYFQRLLFSLYLFSLFLQAFFTKKSVDDEKSESPEALKIHAFGLLP